MSLCRLDFGRFATERASSRPRSSWRAIRVCTGNAS